MEIKQLKVNVLVVSLMDALGIISLRACMFFMVTALSFIHLIVRLNPSTGHSTKQTDRPVCALIFRQSAFYDGVGNVFHLKVPPVACFRVSEAEN